MHLVFSSFKYERFAPLGFKDIGKKKLELKFNSWNIFFNVFYSLINSLTHAHLDVFTNYLISNSLIYAYNHSSFHTVISLLHSFTHSFTHTMTLPLPLILTPLTYLLHDTMGLRNMNVDNFDTIRFGNRNVAACHPFLIWQTFISLIIKANMYY